jgi:hypothetical protein
MPTRLLLVVLALPLAGAACGGSKHAAVAGGDPLTTVKTAFKKTFAAGSESVNLKANAETSGQSLVLSGGGAFNTKSSSGTLRLHIDAGPLATSLDEVIVGSVVYLKFGSTVTASAPPRAEVYASTSGAIPGLGP